MEFSRSTGLWRCATPFARRAVCLSPQIPLVPGATASGEPVLVSGEPPPGRRLFPPIAFNGSGPGGVFLLEFLTFNLHPAQQIRGIVRGRKIRDRENQKMTVLCELLLSALFGLSSLVAVGCEANPTTSDSNDPDGYTNNELGAFQDMLTPAYYHADDGDPFRSEVNRFFFFARQAAFHHPLEDLSGQLRSFSVPTMGEFGAPKGAFQHHAAVDLHVEHGETDVALYAPYDGYVTTVRDAPKYRHYISITKNVEDDHGQVVGRLVTLYGHVDLDLDEADSLFMDGQSVGSGDLVSNHLFAGTVGGPHLHFEIRYYRPDYLGNETFYGGNSGPYGNPDFTEPSAGIWSLGFWHPDIGYGFADPKNQGLFFH